jgi:hypothetical protein
LDGGELAMLNPIPCFICGKEATVEFSSGTCSIEDDGFEGFEPPLMLCNIHYDEWRCKRNKEPPGRSYTTLVTIGKTVIS